MTTYIMEARENYSAALVAQFAAVTQPIYLFTDQQGTGLNFDQSRRKIMYAVEIATGDTTTNSTGHTLWDGLASVANGASVDTIDKWNLWIGEKDIDDDSVTFHQLYNVANVVPSGIGAHSSGAIYFSANPANTQTIVLNGVTWTFVTSGAAGAQTNIQADLVSTIRQLSWDLNHSANASLNIAFYRGYYDAGIGANLTIVLLASGAGGDAYTLAIGSAGNSRTGATTTGGSATGSDGTWRRMNADTSTFGGTVPVLVDAHTNNLWVHAESCFIYRLKYTDSFQQKLSPLRPKYNVNNSIYPIGITTQWFFGFEQQHTGSDYLGYLYLVPAALTALETTLDELLMYGQWQFPADFNRANFRWCLDKTGNVYFLTGQKTASKAHKLWKFTPPTVDGAGLPTTGGAFSDVTPWASNTGPNTNNSTYTTALSGQYLAAYGQNNLMFLPDVSQFVALTHNYPVEKGSSRGTYEDAFFDCTYVDVSGTPSFDYHSAFVTGYMSATWTTTDLAGAAYAVLTMWENNLYYGCTDHKYAGENYTSRWFNFLCYPVVAGAVLGNNPNDLRVVFVKYQFAYGHAPRVVRVIDEIGWDNNYTTYGASLVGPTLTPASVVNGSFLEDNFRWDLYLDDVGLYDTVTNSFWFSGWRKNFYNFDATFTPRATLNGGTPFDVGTAPNPPFMRLSSSAFAEGPLAVEGSDDLVSHIRVPPIPKVRQLRTFEQVPFIEYSVGDTERTAFPIKFKVMAQTDLRVQIDDTELTQGDFTFTGKLIAFPGWDDADAIIADPDFLEENNPYPGYRGGKVTLDVAINNSLIRIWSDPAPTRTTDLVSGELKMAQFNRACETLWVTDRAQHLKLGRDNETLTGSGTLVAASAGLHVELIGPMLATAHAGDTIYNGASTGTHFTSSDANAIAQLVSTKTGLWYVARKSGTWSLA